MAHGGLPSLWSVLEAKGNWRCFTTGAILAGKGCRVKFYSIIVLSCVVIKISCDLGSEKS